MHTIERASAKAATPVAVPPDNQAKRTWVASAALAIAVAVAGVMAVAVSDTEPVAAEPSAVNALVGVQGESYVVAGGQAPSLGSNLRPEVDSDAFIAVPTVPHVVAGGQTPVLSTPAVAAPVPHVVSGGQAPAWNTGAPLVEVEPDPIPVWRPTRDKPGGR